MNWGGIIAAALGGGAQAATDIANNQIAQNSKIDLMKEQAEIEKQKADYADELSRRRALWELDTGPDGYATKRTVADTAREKALQGVRTEAALDLAQRQIPIAVQQEQQVGAAKRTNAVDQAKAVKLAENDIDRADTLAKGADKRYLSARAALTAANHYFGPQDQLAAYNLKRIGQIDALKTKLSTETDRQKRAALQNQISDLEGRTESQADLRRMLDSTENAIQKALSTAVNPMADEETKKSANESVRVLRMQSADISKRLGYDSTGAAGNGPAQSDIDYLKANATSGVKARFDAKFGEGAADKALGATKPAASAPAANTPRSNTRAGSPNGITYRPHGRGTGTYIYQGQTYGTLMEAQKAKDFFEKAWNDAAVERE